MFGASGNTVMMAIQFAKRMEAKVIAVSKDEWVMDFGYGSFYTQRIIFEIQPFLLSKVFVLL